MANKGLSMRKVREVLRLHHVAGLSGRAIARSLKLSPVTVTRYIRRAEEAELSWPLPESLDDAQLERQLLPGAASMPGETRFPVPEWSTVVSGHYEPWLRDRTQCGGGSWLCGPRSDRRGSSTNSDFHIRGVSSMARLAGCMLMRWSTSTR